jgi:hypothetical protein
MNVWCKTYLTFMTNNAVLMSGECQAPVMYDEIIQQASLGGSNSGAIMP